MGKPAPVVFTLRSPPRWPHRPIPLRPSTRVESAPERTQELRVLVTPDPGPRSTRGHKGPDIALLESLWADAREQFDCDEVLLLGKHEYVIEGIDSCFRKWRFCFSC